MAAARPNVLLVGSSHWCRELKRLLNAYSDARCHTIGDAWRWIFMPAKTVCLVGVGAPDTGKRLAYHAVAEWLHRLRMIRSRALYWIGSDAMRLRPGDAHVRGSVNIAGSPWIAEEVRAQGYACVERLFPVEIRSAADCPFPAGERLQVLAYLPDAHHALHGSDEVLHAAAACPDVDFRVIGGSGAWCSERPPNLRFLGWVEDISVPIAACHVLIRRTRHDSFSAFVREGIVAGRHVIFTYDVPGVAWIPAGDGAALAATLVELRNRLASGRLERQRPPAELLRLLSDARSQARALAHELG